MSIKTGITSFAAGLAVTLVLLQTSPAGAMPSFLSTFNVQYQTFGTRLDVCGTCHWDFGGGGDRNPYGQAFEDAGGADNPMAALMAIESDDSDGDGTDNIGEIGLLFMPGYNCENFADTSNAPPNLETYVDPANPGCGAALTLVIDGSCPGVTTLDIAGATPDGTIALLKGTDTGTTVIPSGPCAGLEVPLQNLSLATFLTADGTGDVSLAPNIGNPGVCGTALAAVDVSSCTASNADSIPSGRAPQPLALVPWPVAEAAGP